MAHLHRLIAALVAVFLTVFATLSHAQACTSPYQIRATYANYCGGPGEIIQGTLAQLAQACQGYLAAQGYGNPQCTPQDIAPMTHLTCTRPAGTIPEAYPISSIPTGLVSCPTTEETACLALKDFDAYITVPGRKLPGASMCSDVGCTVKLAPTLIYVKDKNTGAETTQGAGTYTGAACSYSPSTDAAKDPCPKGSKGTVNGVDVCVPYDPTKNVVESVKSGTSTSTVTATTPEGATSTTSSTTAETSSSTRSGDTVSTTTTRVTTNPDGSTTKTESTEQKPAESFCKENPTSPLCRESTFSGSCSANFTCTGDAVMCATARAVNEQKCLLDKQSPEATLYEQSKVNGTATGVQTANHAITSASFDSSNALGASAQCIANRTVTVMGSSITLPFSDICPYLAHLGTLLLAVSWLMAFVIVGKG